MGNALDKLRTLKNDIASSRNKRDDGGGNSAKEEGEVKGAGDTQPVEGGGGVGEHRIEDVVIEEKKDEVVSEDKIGDVSENKIGDVSQDNSEDVSAGDKSKDLPVDNSKDVSEDKSKDVSGDNSKDVAAEKAPVEKKMEAEVAKVVFRFVSWNSHSYLLLYVSVNGVAGHSMGRGWGGVY